MTAGSERGALIEMIRDSAKAVSDDLGRVRALRYRSPGFSIDTWREIAAMGWIGLRVPEKDGGSGLGMIELVALLDELGRGLMPEPLVEGMMSAALLQAASAFGLAEHLTGDVLTIPAWCDGRDALGWPRTGRRWFVAAPEAADSFLLPVERDGRLSLFSISRQACAIEAVGLQDGGFHGILDPDLEYARELAADIGDAYDAALEEAALASAAYALGVAEEAFARTLDFLRERSQFGKPLGSFQALQHRCADIKIQLTLARASIAAAASGMDDGRDRAMTGAAVSCAKARSSDVVMLVAREAIQMHGAIGYTDEHDIGLFARRALVVANRFGSAAYHRSRFMALNGAEE